MDAITNALKKVLRVICNCYFFLAAAFFFGWLPGADMQQRQSGVGVSVSMKGFLEIMKLDTLII